MNNLIFLIGLSYVVVVALLIAVFIYSKAPIWAKFSLLAISGAMFTLHSSTLINLLGWPVNQELPAKFVILSSHVNEPIKSEQYSGKIYLWLTEIEGTEPQRRPRAYTLEYSKTLHSQIEQTNKRRKKGIVQLGEASLIDNKIAKTSSLTTANATQLISIYDLPDPALPEK
ncbi:MAG: hypothetical protein P8O97_06735 [Gammaproteobacteria bacterium]|nr:hypothetical protein [Gammaproteobacteria bacterium]